MNLKIGQKVTIEKKVLEKMVKDSTLIKMPIWINNNIYIIKDIDNKQKIAFLNIKLANTDTNKINIIYLKSIKKRKKRKTS